MEMRIRCPCCDSLFMMDITDITYGEKLILLNKNRDFSELKKAVQDVVDG